MQEKVVPVCALAFSYTIKIVNKPLKHCHLTPLHTVLLCSFAKNGDSLYLQTYWLPTLQPHKH